MLAYAASVKELLRASDLVDQGTKELFATAAAGYDSMLQAVTEAVGVSDTFGALVRGEMRLGRVGQEPFVHCELPDEAAWAFPGKLAAHTVQSPPSGTCHPAATPSHTHTHQYFSDSERGLATTTRVIQNTPSFITC